jgi:hypothetical protein
MHITSPTSENWKKKHLIVLVSQFMSLIYFHNLLRWLLSQKNKIGLLFHYFNLTHLISEIQMCQANSFAIS